MSDYVKQLEQRIEELEHKLATRQPWEPYWFSLLDGDVPYQYRNDYVVLAEVHSDFLIYKAKFYVKTNMNYDLQPFRTPEEARDFITEEIKGIAWKLIRKK
jgi:hypothetical protein